MKGGDGKGQRILQGIASTEDVDAQNEMVLQRGIDFQPFIDQGFINWNHQPGPENIIGQPLEAKITSTNDGKPAFYVKALIYTGIGRADEAWNLINTLEKARSDGAPARRLGWSVEGGVLERRGTMIARSVVRQVALTHEPVAFNTFAELAKSMTKAQTAGDVAPLMMQNLAGQKYTAKQIRLALYGDKADQCQADHGQFKKSRGRGLLEHLIGCEGWEKLEATDLVISLWRNLN